MSQKGPGPPNRGTDLSELIGRHGRAYFGTAMGILRDKATAEDVCQQALLKAWQERGRLRDGRALHAWVLRVVVNESLRVLRRRKTERRVLQKVGPGTTPTTAPPAGDTMGMREAVLDALTSLDEPTRTIVTLRVIQGMTGNQVKEALSCSASEVSRRLHEGMEQLRPMLAEWRGQSGRLE